MDVIDANLHVAKARAAIAETLAALERDTGLLVEDLSLERIEVTTMADQYPKHRMDVRIEMQRKVGHEW